MTNTFVFCIIELDEDEDEAENQAESLQRFNTTARKQSLLPIVNFDEDDLSSEDNDDEDDEDNDDEDYEDK